MRADRALVVVHELLPTNSGFAPQARPRAATIALPALISCRQLGSREAR